MAYRITTHKGRTTKGGKAYSARHLDRKFPLKNAPHIDPTRTHLNRYVEFHVAEDGVLHHKKSQDIQRHELAMYERLFKPRLDIINENYIKQRHKERCKSVRQYYTAVQTCPDEYLIYIGDKDNHANSDILKGAASELISSLQKKYSKNFIPLSIAVHRDEKGIGEDGEGAHIHFRCVWISSDKNGTKVSITQGMKEAGIELPDAEKCEQKYNNRQMVFSEEIRETFADICEQMYGLEIEREARDASKSGKDLATYQRDKAVEEVKILTRERDNLQEEVSALKGVIARFKRLLAPISKLIDKLSIIRTRGGKSALDEVVEDAEMSESFKALHELERC